MPAALESTGARMLLAAWGAVEVLRLSSSDSLRMTPRLFVALSIRRTARNGCPTWLREHSANRLKPSATGLVVDEGRGHEGEEED